MKKGILYFILKYFWLLFWLCLWANQNDALGQTAIVPDTNFRNFLLNTFPTVIDNNGRLVITEAAKITDDIDGSNLKISSIEGIQYFTSTKAVKFVRTGLSFVPDLSNMVNLVDISLMYNNLTSLPNLSNLKKLQHLLVHSNKLVSLPDLSQNVNLLELNINGNQIDSLIGLAALAKIETLWVHNNKLRSLSGIEKLTSLKIFWCYSNPISSFPLLDKLSNIKDFDAAKCSLITAPDFGTKSGIKTINLGRNQIKTLANYSGYDSLSKVMLQSNSLTFGELTKLVTKKNYDSIFQIAPQKTISIAKSLTLKEATSFTFATGIDTLVTGVVYNWYKNGTKMASVTGDKWVIPSIQLQDSGQYFCQLSLPSFDNFFLQTDTFKLSVAPCLDVNKISTSVIGATCKNSGSLAVIFPVQGLYTYELKSLGSGRLYTSNIGKFEGLSEPNYTLSIISTTGCTKKYPKGIQIPVEKCLDFVLTPNNDGNADTYFFEANGKVEIYDKWGNVVKRLNAPAEWDCTNDKGKVPNGYYIANVNEGESHIGLSVVY